MCDQAGGPVDSGSGDREADEEEYVYGQRRLCGRSGSVAIRGSRASVE